MASPQAGPDDMTTAALRARLQGALGAAFRLGDELGGGGASRLFVAEQRLTRRPVVVKVLAGAGVGPATIRRFRQEVAVMAALQHPHILPVLAAGEGAGLAYFVTPLVADGSLRARLRGAGRLEVPEVARLLQQVAGALAHAHARGVVHGDLKPENILLQQGHAVLADFGGSRLRLGRGQSAAAGPVMGTPLYMSPEQAAGEAAVDARSDLYSLAVVGWELLAGRPPFTGATPHAVLSAHLGAPVPSVTAARPEVPAAISRILARAMAKDPADRYSSAEAFRRALATAVIAPSAVAPRATPVAPLARRAAAVLLTIGTAGAATIGAAHLFASGFGMGPAPALHAAFADRPATAIVAATDQAEDTMAARIAVLPPMVATAPRPTAPAEEAVLAPVTGGAISVTSAAIASDVVSVVDVADEIVAVTRVATADVAELAPRLLAALPADVHVVVRPDVEALTAMAEGRVVLRAEAMEPLRRLAGEEAAMRFRVSAQDVEELRRAVHELRAGRERAAGVRAKRVIHGVRAPRPPAPPAAARTTESARAAAAQAAVVAEAPCTGAQASGAA